jgi:hypothetical protein
MQEFSVEVFDEIITGAVPSWFTSTEFDSLLGSAEALVLLVTTTFVSGTSPTLGLTSQHSADGLVFSDRTSFGSTSIGNGLTFAKLDANAALGLVRLRLALGGTSPRCRVKVIATGRAS